VSALWKGGQKLRELPALNIEETLETTVRDQEYEGPHSLCLSQRPKPGQIDEATGLMITNVKVTRRSGGLGKLSLRLEWKLNTGTPPPAGQTQELDWVETDKDLLQNPRYQTGGAKYLDDDAVVALKCWEDEPNWKLKKAFKYREDTSKPNAEQKTLSAPAQDYAKKRLRGQDTYRVYLPVVKRTTKISTPISGDQCGKKLSNLPSGLPCPTGYYWIKTADRSIRSGGGKWERSEEWSGYTYIDGDLY
jgi:hypothetical protein